MYFKEIRLGIDYAQHKHEIGVYSSNLEDNFVVITIYDKKDGDRIVAFTLKHHEVEKLRALLALATA